MYKTKKQNNNLLCIGLTVAFLLIVKKNKKVIPTMKVVDKPIKDIIVSKKAKFTYKKPNKFNPVMSIGNVSFNTPMTNDTALLFDASTIKPVRSSKSSHIITKPSQSIEQYERQLDKALI